MEPTNTTANLYKESYDLLEKTLSHPFIFCIRSFWYVVTPSETSFEKLVDVPKYTDKTIPCFVVFIVLEYLFLRYHGKEHLGPKFTDTIASLCAFLFSVAPSLMIGSLEILGYLHIYDNWRLLELPWDNAWTWFLGFLGVDFGYYWLHRTAHELSLFWAGHQAHHSSDEFNLSTALRQSVIQKSLSWIFYLPLAFVLPPTIAVVHIHFNFICQFWIHTQAIGNLGPLEYIFNTPTHHRVHHGRNRYCIDKNYGGALIIWDRMFGTFEPERDEPVYGLVYRIESWDTILIQFAFIKPMMLKAWTMEGKLNTLWAFLKGPLWEPGKPRLGLSEDRPDVCAPQPKYDKPVRTLQRVYCGVHLMCAFVLYMTVKDNQHAITLIDKFLTTVYLVGTISSIGFILENKWYASYFEFLRCVMYLVADTVATSGVQSSYLDFISRSLFLISICFLAIDLIRQTVYDKKKDTKIN